MVAGSCKGGNDIFGSIKGKEILTRKNVLSTFHGLDFMVLFSYLLNSLWCLRYIMKVWWPRVISNEKLWEMSGQININKEIRQRKFGWIGHTLRKDDSEPCKAALQWNPQGTRRRGRPRNAWRRTTLNESGKHSWSDLRFIARNREGWRRFVDNLCS
jgi:hypothetical protein